MTTDSEFLAAGQCLHLKWWKSGSANGKQRRQCSFCGKTRFEGAVPRVLRYERALQVFPYFKRNLTLLEIASTLRIGKTTAWRAVQTIKDTLRRTA